MFSKALDIYFIELVELRIGLVLVSPVNPIDLGHFNCELLLPTHSSFHSCQSGAPILCLILEFNYSGQQSLLDLGHLFLVMLHVFFVLSDLSARCRNFPLGFAIDKLSLNFGDISVVNDAFLNPLHCFKVFADPA